MFCRQLTIGTLVATLTVPCLANPTHIPLFQIVDLGPADFQKQVYINQSGQVAGTADGDAFFWDHGRRIDIGHTASYPHSMAAGVNDRGVVAGTLDNTVEGADMVFNDDFFLWRDGKLTDLGTPPGNDVARAAGINDEDVIVGTRVANGDPNPADPSDNASHAIQYENGKWIDLPEGDAVAGVNNSGEVAGSGTAPNGTYQAIVWSRGKAEYLGPASEVGAINDIGDVVIVRDTALFLDRSGVIRPLKFPPGITGLTASTPIGINIHDQIVAAGTTSAYASVAILWEDGTPLELKTLIRKSKGWDLQAATGINNRGQIVGTGTYKGSTHAFLLTPTENK